MHGPPLSKGTLLRGVTGTVSAYFILTFNSQRTKVNMVAFPPHPIQCNRHFLKSAAQSPRPEPRRATTSDSGTEPLLPPLHPPTLGGDPVECSDRREPAGGLRWFTAPLISSTAPHSTLQGTNERRCVTTKLVQRLA